MIDASITEAAAHSQPGMTGTDDYGVDLHRALLCHSFLTNKFS
jgi:hypothetical protein